MRRPSCCTARLTASISLSTPGVRVKKGGVKEGGVKEGGVKKRWVTDGATGESGFGELG